MVRAVPGLENAHRLIALAKEARDRITEMTGTWRRDAAREARTISPVPVPDEDAALPLQHALRDGLMSAEFLAPGYRHQVGRGLHEIAMSLTLMLHGKGLSPANQYPPRMVEVPADTPSPRYNPGVD